MVATPISTIKLTAIATASPVHTSALKTPTRFRRLTGSTPVASAGGPASPKTKPTGSALFSSRPRRAGWYPQTARQGALVRRPCKPGGRGSYALPSLALLFLTLAPERLFAIGGEAPPHCLASAERKSWELLKGQWCGSVATRCPLNSGGHRYRPKAAQSPCDQHGKPGVWLALVVRPRRDATPNQGPGAQRPPVQTFSESGGVNRTAVLLKSVGDLPFLSGYGLGFVLARNQQSGINKSGNSTTCLPSLEPQGSSCPCKGLLNVKPCRWVVYLPGDPRRRSAASLRRSAAVWVRVAPSAPNKKPRTLARSGASLLRG